MSILIIGDEERAAIKAAIERARSKPILWDQMKHAAIRGDTKPILELADRMEGFSRPESEHVTLGLYRAAISFEQQPAGLVRHLSVSSRKAGRVPGLEVMKMVAAEFGFTKFPPSQGQVWLEEFERGHHAVNAAELVYRTEGGNA